MNSQAMQLKEESAQCVEIVCLNNILVKVWNDFDSTMIQPIKAVLSDVCIYFSQNNVLIDQSAFI